MTDDQKHLVIGGGLAGSMAAIRLASSGHAVNLLERSRGPHDKVCGEFLSGEAVAYLEAVGQHPNTLGGVPIRSVRLITNQFQDEAALPFPAWSVTRRVLDEAMLQAAAEAGVHVERDAAVRSLEKEDGRWTVLLRDERTMQADNVLLATGKLDVNGWARPSGMQAGLVGFKMYYRLSEGAMQRLGSAVELVPFPGGYAGMQRVEGGLANLCLLIDLSRVPAGERQWAGVLSHIARHSSHLSRQLEQATAMLSRPLTASHLPYGHVQRRTEPGLWRLGDQAAVIPSFCGDGMAIALHSGALAAMCLAQGMTATAYQARLHGQVALRVWTATRLSQIMVQAPAALHLLHLFPRLLHTVANITRISERALATTRFGTEGKA